MIELTPAPGNKAVFLDIENLDHMTRRAIRHGFFKFGKALHSEANREILRRPKSGRIYIRRDKAGRKRKHRASAPGETHANMTGALRRSIGWKVTAAVSMEFGYGADGKPTPDYDAAIEFGFKARNLEPRPSLQNAIAATQRTGENYFINSLRDAFE